MAKNFKVYSHVPNCTNIMYTMAYYRGTFLSSLRNTTPAMPLSLDQMLNNKKVCRTIEDS